MASVDDKDQSRVQLMSWRRLKVVVKHHPLTVIGPLLVTSALIAVGVWGTVYGAEQQKEASRNAAFYNASGIAIELRAELTKALIVPSVPITIMIQLLGRNYAALMSSWTNVVRSGFRVKGDPYGPATTLQLAPGAVISSTNSVSENGSPGLPLGTDLFAGYFWDSLFFSSIDDLVAHGPLALGPFGFPATPDILELVFVQPIFIDNVSSAEEGFGRPFTSEFWDECTVCYEASNRTAFWGFSLVSLRWLAFLEVFDLEGTLKQSGYNYRVTRMAYSSERVDEDKEVWFMGSEAGLEDPVRVEFDFWGSTWYLYINDPAGWDQEWLPGVLVVVIVVSLLIGFLLMAVVIIGMERQMLLHVVAPKEVIRKLLTSDDYLQSRMTIVNPGTPADLMVNVISAIVAGREPNMKDVAMVRTALVHSKDIYCPINLLEQLAQLDSDVARNLMRELGQQGGASMFERETQAPGCQPYAEEDDVSAGAEPGPWTSNLLVVGDGVGRTESQATVDIMMAMMMPDSCFSQVSQHLRGSQPGDSASHPTAIDAQATGKVSNRTSPPNHAPSSGSSVFNSEDLTIPMPPGQDLSAPSSGMPIKCMSSRAKDGLIPSPVNPGARSPAICSTKQVARSMTSSMDVCSNQSRLSTCVTPMETAISLTAQMELSQRVLCEGHTESDALACLKESRFTPSPGLPLFEEVEQQLGSAYHSWEFDSFKLHDSSCGHPLSVLCFFLIKKTGLMSKFNIKEMRLARFLRAAEAGYEDNPYHNRTHAADVLQTMHVIMTHGGLIGGYADPLTHLACLLAAAVHDLEHIGLTNDFIINMEHPLALMYNDRSPMENHHLSAAFKLLRRPGLDFFSHMPRAERNKLRKTMIELVLGTDMKQHFSIHSQFSTGHSLTTTPKPLETINGRSGTAAGGLGDKTVDGNGNSNGSIPQVSLSGATGGEGKGSGTGQQEDRCRKKNLSIPRTANQAAAGQRRRSSLSWQRSTSASEPHYTRGSMSGPNDEPVQVTSPEDDGHNPPLSNENEVPVTVVPITPIDEAERMLTLQVALKCADIGLIAEGLEVHLKWVYALEDEFYRQGDLEKEHGLPISPLFDRAKPGVSKSQPGFFDFVAVPMFHNFCAVFPGCQPLMDRIAVNYAYWKAKGLEGKAKEGDGDDDSSPAGTSTATATSTSPSDVAAASNSNIVGRERYSAQNRSVRDSKGGDTSDNRRLSSLLKTASLTLSGTGPRLEKMSLSLFGKEGVASPKRRNNQPCVSVNATLPPSKDIPSMSRSNPHISVNGAASTSRNSRQASVGEEMHSYATLDPELGIARAPS